MPYIIDGHNLIGQLPDISLDDPNDEAKLVQKLTGFCARSGKRCVVVFDSGLPGGRSRMSSAVVEVVFASEKTNADRLILQRIRQVQDAKNWTVVSSDNVVLEAAHQQGMQSIKSADFARQMLALPKAKPKAYGGKSDMDVHVSAAEVEHWLKVFCGK